MTKSEASVVVKKISMFYPNEYNRISPEGMKQIVEMWASTSVGYTGEQMLGALQQFMASDTSGFAPKPGQLIKFIKPERSAINNFADMPSHKIVIDEKWWAELAAKPGNLI